MDTTQDSRENGGKRRPQTDGQNRASQRPGQSTPEQLRRPADSPAFQKMMEAYLSAPFSGNERAVVSKVCRKLLNKTVRPSLAVPYVVALGKRNLLWDLLPDHIEEHVLEVEHAE